jgi:hypothetical protein
MIMEREAIKMPDSPEKQPLTSENKAQEPDETPEQTEEIDELSELDEN